jgi:transposase
VAFYRGIVLSTLTRCKRRYRYADFLPAPHEHTTKDRARLRMYNELLRLERFLLKKATAFFARETSR